MANQLALPLLLLALVRGSPPTPSSAGESSRATQDRKGALPPAGMAEARRRIDGIDGKLLTLLSERARSALEIAEIKRENRLPIRNLRREEEVLAALAAHNPGPLPEESIRRIWERIFEEMRALESRPSGSPSPR